MSEPPVEMGADGVQPRPPRTGGRWVDFGMAGVAVLISVVSLAVSFYNAQSQQRMDKVAGLIWESRAIGLYRSGERNNILVLAREPGNATVWQRLSHARVQLKFEACYCSVLNDCWTSNLDPVSDPKPVSHCAAVGSYQE